MKIQLILTTISITCVPHVFFGCPSDRRVRKGEEKMYDDVDDDADAEEDDAG